VLLVVLPDVDEVDVCVNVTVMVWLSVTFDTVPFADVPKFPSRLSTTLAIVYPELTVMEYVNDPPLVTLDLLTETDPPAVGVPLALTVNVSLGLAPMLIVKLIVAPLSTFVPDEGV
jgi:hypothetical protein